MNDYDYLRGDDLRYLTPKGLAHELTKVMPNDDAISNTRGVAICTEIRRRENELDQPGAVWAEVRAGLADHVIDSLQFKRVETETDEIE